MSSARDVSELASHTCAIVSDGEFGVFVKFSQAEDAIRQFRLEIDGLEYLSAMAGVKVPTPIGLVRVENGALLVMEALVEIERQPEHWREIGRSLAHLHQVKSEWCGFQTDNYLGPLRQENAPLTDWTAFYVERRLKPYLKLAVETGQLPSRLIEQVERVIERMPEWRLPAVTPALLHGDAQSNNYVSTREGIYLIDPAVYYGNPELDLAYLDLWHPVPQEVFDGYQEVLPIDPGFYTRRDLWKLSVYLAAIVVEGAVYVGRLENALLSWL